MVARVKVSLWACNEFLGVGFGVGLGFWGANKKAPAVELGFDGCKLFAVLTLWLICVTGWRESRLPYSIADRAQGGIVLYIAPLLFDLVLSESKLTC